MRLWLHLCLCKRARVSVYLCASYVHNRALAESSGGHLIALQSQRDCVALCAPCSESGRADQAETKTVVAPCRLAPWQLHRLGLQLRCGCGLIWAAQLCGEWRQLCDGLWAELRRWRAQREHCAVGGIVCHMVMDVGDSVELLVESRYVAPRRFVRNYDCRRAWQRPQSCMCHLMAQCCHISEHRICPSLEWVGCMSRD